MMQEIYDEFYVGYSYLDGVFRGITNHGADILTLDQLQKEIDDHQEALAFLFKIRSKMDENKAGKNYAE